MGRDEITYVYAQRHVVSHDQSFAWRNELHPFQGWRALNVGHMTPTFYANENIACRSFSFQLDLHLTCAHHQTNFAFLSLLLFQLLSIRIMLTFGTSPTRRLWNVTVQPATSDLPFSNDDITVDDVETSSAASILHTPFHSTNMLAFILKAPRTEHATHASTTTGPGTLPGRVGATVSFPAKASNRQRQLLVYQTRVRSARIPRKSAV